RRRRSISPVLRATGRNENRYREGRGGTQERCYLHKSDIEKVVSEKERPQGAWAATALEAHVRERDLLPRCTSRKWNEPRSFWRRGAAVGPLTHRAVCPARARISARRVGMPLPLRWRCHAVPRTLRWRARTRHEPVRVPLAPAPFPAKAAARPLD